MTTNQSPSIADETEFRTQLHELLMRAHRGGVSLEGGWSCLNSDGNPSWDVEIYRVKRTQLFDSETE